jgi:hypothetical protein
MVTPPKLVELLVIAVVAGLAKDDAALLVVASSVAGKLGNLGGEISRMAA